MTLGHSASCRLWNCCVAIHYWCWLFCIHRDLWIIFPRKAESLVKHTGGCHCGAIRFQVWNAADLHVFDCKYGLWWRSTDTNSSRFLTHAGQSCVITLSLFTLTAVDSVCSVAVFVPRNRTAILLFPRPTLRCFRYDSASIYRHAKVRNRSGKHF